MPDASQDLSEKEEESRPTRLTDLCRHVFNSYVGLGLVFLAVFAVVAVACALRPEANDRPKQPEQLRKKPTSDVRSYQRNDRPEEPVQIFEKPTADPRSYQHSVLPNGLQVVNIQDKQSQSFAMAMAIRAGSYDDPVEFPGLAHFCEHMLFLGTEKYPDATGFDDFMSRAEGTFNAYTADESTVYFFSSSAQFSKEASSRFADFFRAPLFNRDFVEKEVHAIDSEHSKNIDDDTWRVLQVIHDEAANGSAVKRFETGNLETLLLAPRRRGEDTVAALKRYFHDRYCASQMRLVTFGASSLEEQLRHVAVTFADIPVGPDACRLSSRSFAVPQPYPGSRMSREVMMRGASPQGQLWMHFELMDLKSHFSGQPLSYLDWVLSYQGENSLSMLLSDGLGLSQSISTTSEDTSAGTAFYIVVVLTEKGVQHPEVVLDMVFGYLAMLRRLGVNELLYKSIADIQRLLWDWSSSPAPVDAVSTMADAMTWLPVKKLLLGSRIDVPDPELVAALLRLLVPSNLNVIRVMPAALGEVPLQGTGLAVKTEPFYGVQCVTRQFSEAMPGAAARWSAWLEGRPLNLTQAMRAQLRALGNFSDLELPPLMPRPLAIPKDLDLSSMHAEASQLYGPRPKLTAGQRQQELWYRKGWVTISPTVWVELLFRPFLRPHEPEVLLVDAVRAKLYSRLLQEELAPKLYDLSLAGATIQTELSPRELHFSISGFLPVVEESIKRMLETFTLFNQTASSKQARYARVMEDYKQELQTFSELALVHARDDRNIVLSSGYFSRGEQLASLSDSPVTLDVVARAAEELLLARPLLATSLLMGNSPAGTAERIMQGFARGVQGNDGMMESRPSSRSSSGGNTDVERIGRVVKLTSPVEIRRPNPKAGDPNDAVVMTILKGVVDVESRAVFSMLGDILQTRTYGELRSQRQLGYVVEAGASLISNIMAVTFLVEGTVLRADDVEAAIESVFSTFASFLANMTEEDFQSHRDSLRQSLREPPSDTRSQVEFYWKPVAQASCFDIRQQFLEFLDSSRFTRHRLLETWYDLAEGGKAGRQKITVKYFAGGKAELPPRPSLSEAKAAWLWNGVSPDAFEKMSHEWEKTQVFHTADSSVRGLLWKQGGYFSSDIPCDSPTKLVEVSRRRLRTQRAMLGTDAG